VVCQINQWCHDDETAAAVVELLILLLLLLLLLWAVGAHYVQLESSCNLHLLCPEHIRNCCSWIFLSCVLPLELTDQGARCLLRFLLRCDDRVRKSRATERGHLF
jgi:hypothetical protein